MLPRSSSRVGTEVRDESRRMPVSAACRQVQHLQFRALLQQSQRLSHPLPQDAVRESHPRRRAVGCGEVVGGNAQFPCDGCDIAVRLPETQAHQSRRLSRQAVTLRTPEAALQQGRPEPPQQLPQEYPHQPRPCDSRPCLTQVLPRHQDHLPQGDRVVLRQARHLLHHRPS